MTHENAVTLARQLKEACPELVTAVWPAEHPHEYIVRILDLDLDPFAVEWVRLPDALSVRAYLDARRGYRTEAGAPDFGPGRV